jgi:phage shock protein C
MFCTRCGVELRDHDKFCCACGSPTGIGPAAAARADQLSRPTGEAKIAGVCAGFARHFKVDVTLVRVLWLAMTIWPLPLFGIVTYIVAWIVMPKDPVVAPAQHLRPANGQAT